MSEHGMFVGWGEPIAGREQQGIAVFREALEYFASLQQSGVIVDHQVVILGPHGDDLQGFVLLLGEPDKLNGLVNSPEWSRFVTRASYVAHSFGVVPAFLGSEGTRLVEAMETETTDLR